MFDGPQVHKGRKLGDQRTLESAGVDDGESVVVVPIAEVEEDEEPDTAPVSCSHFFGTNATATCCPRNLLLALASVSMQPTRFWNTEVLRNEAAIRPTLTGAVLCPERSTSNKPAAPKVWDLMDWVALRMLVSMIFSIQSKTCPRHVSYSTDPSLQDSWPH